MNIQITPAASTEVASVTIALGPDKTIYIQEKLTLTLSDDSEFSPVNQGVSSENPLSTDDQDFISAVETALDTWRKAKGI